MLNAYDVLGVPATADRGEIRAAYVHLAKQLHPDRIADSAQTEQRLREVNQAYELLKDPARRSAHDHLLQQSQGRAQWRRRRAAAVMAASFVLTAVITSGLSLLARYSLLADPMQASGNGELIRLSQDSSLVFTSAGAEVGSEAQVNNPAADETSLRLRNNHLDASTLIEPTKQQLAALQTRNLAGLAAGNLAQQHAWITYRNDRFGFALDYPADVFMTDDRAIGDFWRLFVSHDGQARLLVTAGFNNKRLTSASYRQSMLNEVYRGASIEYAPLRMTWFVLAGSRGEEMFYDRATFACDGRIIHRWRLTYPSRAREYYSKIIERIHQGYKHARGAGKHCF